MEACTDNLMQTAELNYITAILNKIGENEKTRKKNLKETPSPYKPNRATVNSLVDKAFTAERI